MPIRVSVIIKPQGLRQRVARAENQLRRVPDNYLLLESKIIKTTMKILVPVRTGALRNSIRVIKKVKAGSGLDRRANIIIAPTVEYASAVDQGARKSPGMFVPRLGVRVKHGFHPGQVAQHYIQRTVDMVEADIQTNFNRTFIVPLSRTIRNIGARTL